MKNLTIGMPIYWQDNVSHVKEALISLKGICEETQLLFIHDGSNDELEALLMSFDFPFVQIHVNNAPKGLACVLNQMLEMCKTDYFRRLDSDDIIVAKGLKNQIDWMVQKDLDICGSHAYWLKNDDLTDILYTKPNYTRWPISTFWITPFIHPTVIFKVSSLRKNSLNYACNNQELKEALIEDWYLWNQCRVKGLRLGNYSEPTIYYRVKDVRRQIERFKTSLRLKRQSFSTLELGLVEGLVARIGLFLIALATPFIVQLYKRKFG